MSVYLHYIDPQTQQPTDVKVKPYYLQNPDSIVVELLSCDPDWYSKYIRTDYTTQDSTSAYINTGLQFKDVGWSDITFQYNIANFTCVCGGATGGGNNYVCWYSNQLHEGRGGNVIDSGNDRIIGHQYRLISNKTRQGIAYRDGEFLKNFTSQMWGSQSTVDVGLFAFGGGEYSGGNQNIYYAEFRTSEDGEILGKYIPCIRTSDSHAGMYDMVTKQFVDSTNSSLFTAGPIKPFEPKSMYFRDIKY